MYLYDVDDHETAETLHFRSLEDVRARTKSQRTRELLSEESGDFVMG